MDEKTPSLCEKVKSWFEAEGYPLEFRVARAFEEQGFTTHQGYYVVDEAEGQPREIDIVADVDLELGKGDGFLRVSHVIECKWSREKPWVIFTSRRSVMAESACIAQTLASPLGEAIMFCVAGERDLYPLGMFKGPERGGFSGRRAFEKQDKDTYDQFYRSIQGVVSAAAAKAKAFSPTIRDGKAPRDGLIVFLLIVVEANLFEAYYDPHGDEVHVSEVDQLRVFWRGAKATRRRITAVDIVTADVISDFARNRISEIDQFLTEAAKAVARIRAAFAEGSIGKLAVKAAPRGFTGLPSLLVDLHELSQSKKGAPTAKRRA